VSRYQQNVTLSSGRTEQGNMLEYVGCFSTDTETKITDVEIKLATFPIASHRFTT